MFVISMYVALAVAVSVVTLLFIRYYIWIIPTLKYVDLTRHWHTVSLAGDFNITAEMLQKIQLKHQRRREANANERKRIKQLNEAIKRLKETTNQSSSRSVMLD